MEAVLHIDPLYLKLQNFGPMQAQGFVYPKDIPAIFQAFKQQVPEFYLNETRNQEELLGFYANITGAISSNIPAGVQLTKFGRYGATL